MNPDKTALVLGGGGSRGAYEIGVWRALKELGIGFSIVTGTSVGALNGAIIAQGDYDTAVRVWSSITNETVLNLDVPLEKPFDEAGLRERLEFLGTFAREIAVQGGADTSPLKKLLEDVLDERAIRASDVRFGLVTVRLPDMRPKAVYLSELPEGTLVDYVLASASCFPAMQSHEIDGKAYIDGGYFDNLPIELAIQGGAEAVIAVDIKGLGRRRKADGIDPEKLHMITTPWNLGSMLVFDADTARRNMELGYLDAMKSWGRLQGTLYAFDSDPKTAFEPLFTKALTLFSRLYPDSGTTGALHRLTKLRLLRHLYSLYRGMPNAPVPTELRGDASAHILPMAFAENAGRVFGLDPTVVYSPEAFATALKTALASVQPLDFGKAESLFSEWKPISDFASEVAEKLEGITPPRIAKSIYEYLLNHRNVPAHWTTALPAEFMAALAMMSV